MRRREATAPALDDVEAVAGDVIAYPSPDARLVDRPADDTGTVSHGIGSAARIAASAWADGDKPCPRTPRSLSVRSPAPSGRGAIRPSADVGTASRRDASRPKAAATRRANSGRSRISGPAIWNVPRAERSTSATIARARSGAGVGVMIWSIGTLKRRRARRLSTSLQTKFSRAVVQP